LLSPHDIAHALVRRLCGGGGDEGGRDERRVVV
jgi:hypothetical protein